MTRASRVTPKFIDEPCPRCGKPHSVVNGAYLRRVRLDAGITLREMGRRLHFSAPYLSDIERGSRNALPKIVAAYEALSS